MAEDDSPTGSYSALDSSNIALRSLNRRRDMHRSQDVSSSNSSLRNSRSTATLRNKKWRKQKDSEAEDEANDLLLPAERGAMGQGETEGVYDQGWKGTDGQEEDDTATIASTDTAKLKQETKSRWNAFRGRAPKATKPRTIPNNAPGQLPFSVYASLLTVRCGRQAAISLSTQHCSKSEVQRRQLLAYSPIRAVQVLLQSVLPSRGRQSDSTSSSDRCV